MAALKVELTARLDVSTLVQGLLTEIAGPAGGLQGVSAPLSESQLSGIAAGGVSFEGTGLEASISGFASVVTSRIGELPVAGDALEQIIRTLELIENLASGDLGGQISGLFDRLKIELEGESGSPINLLLKLSEILGQSDLSQAINALLGLLTGGGGIFPREIGDLLPGSANTIRVIGGLMVYESALSETERLAVTLGNLFDSNRAQQELVNISKSLQSGGMTLAQRLALANVSDPVELESVTLALEQAASRISALNDYVSERMGFGEATLEYLDIGAVQVELATAGILLRNPDLSALKRFIDSAVAKVDPYLAIDPSAMASRTVDQVLAEVEARRDEFVSAIQSLDVGIITGPFNDGITFATTPLREFSQLLDQLTLQIRSVLDQVRQLVEGLPFDDIANSIRAVLQPVADAIRFIQEVIDQIKAALEVAANAAQAAMGEIEEKVDAFKAAIESVFGEAKQFIDGLHLEQLAGEIGGRVQAFSDLLAQAEMKPYFDTASDAIDTAADIIENIPFALIPEAMKAEVDKVCEPIRAIDARQVEAEIESLLAISPDGKFELRGDIVAALADIQQKFDEILTVLNEHHPRTFLEQIDTELNAIAARIRELTPELALEPVQEAIDQLKEALASFDPDEQLKPVNDAFAQILTKMDEFSPVRLIKPIEDRVTEVRELVIDTIKLDEWRPAVDGLAERATELLEVLNPDAVEEQVRELLQLLKAEIARMPDVQLFGWVGTLVAGLLRGANMRVSPASFEAVLRWIETGNGAAELTARSARIADALARAKTQVEGFDIAAASASLAPRVRELKTAATAFSARLSAGDSHRLRVDASIGQLELEAVVSNLAANRTRYLGLLNTAVGLGENLRRTGMSEVDVAVNELKNATAGVSTVTRHFRDLLSAFGITGTEGGLRQVLQRVLDDATIDRLGNVIVPIIEALHGRIVAFLNGVLEPIRRGIGEVETLIAHIDLAPLRISLQSIFDAAVNEVSSLNPVNLLKEPLDAFRELRQDLLTFDPLAVIFEILEALQETAARLLEKLNVQKLLETPLAIYDDILAAFAALDFNALLAPILDRLDAIAQQVDEGLDATVTAFERFQESLPPPGGGSTVSVDIGVSVGL
jgi:lysophospholipase L1-like esterase